MRIIKKMDLVRSEQQHICNLLEAWSLTSRIPETDVDQSYHCFNRCQALLDPEQLAVVHYRVVSESLPSASAVFLMGTVIFTHVQDFL